MKGMKNTLSHRHLVHAGILITGLLLLNIADFEFTRRLIEAFGFEVELNPILYHLMVKTNSVTPILFVKGLFLGLIGAVYIHIFLSNNVKAHKFFISLSKIAIILYLGVASWGLFNCYISGAI